MRILLSLIIIHFLHFPLPPDWCHMNCWMRTIQTLWRWSYRLELSTSSKTALQTLTLSLRELTSVTSRSAEPHLAEPVSESLLYMLCDSKVICVWGLFDFTWPLHNLFTLHPILNKKSRFIVLFPSSSPDILHHSVSGGPSQDDQWWQENKHKVQVLTRNKGHKGI